MKIAVNTRFLIKDKLEGIGWFTYEVLLRLTKKNPQHEFLFIFDRPYSDEFIFSDNITPIVVGPPARHAFLFYLWFEYSIPKVLKKHQPDVFFSPDGYLSLKTDIPQINVIHDLAFEHFPEHVPFFARKYYQYFFPKYAEIAQKIITVSTFSKTDISYRYAINSHKIEVVYNGVSRLYKPIDKFKQYKVRKKYTGGNPYFIYVGSLNPRKNIKRLLQAFDVFCAANKNHIQLLIVGEKMWNDSSLENAYNTMKNKDRVVFTGRLSLTELPRVMATAQALIYVSLFEGFGLPLLEAMRCGVPVVTSEGSSMPEIAGNAALLVNPNSVTEIAIAMKNLSKNNANRERLIEAGLERVKDFNWNKTAKQIGGLLFDKISTQQRR